MASFRVEWKRSALKEMRSLSRDVVRRVVDCVEGLKVNPFPAGCRKLTGSEHSYRLRIGDYRVVYSVQSSRLVVEVVRVAHRRDAYR